MNRIRDLLAAGLIAAIATGIVAGAVIWKITARQRDFVAAQFAAQDARIDAKIQAVTAALGKATDNLKRLDGALRTTETTLRGVKDQVSLVGTRNGIAALGTMVKDANKALADIKQATAPDRARGRLEAALAPLAGKLDAVDKAVTALQSKLADKTRRQALDRTLGRIETAIAGVKDAIATRPADPALTQANARLADALTSLAALGQTLDAIESGVAASATKLDRTAASLTALDTTVKQGFAATAAKQAALSKAVAKPVPPPAKPAKPEQDLVVFYVAMAGKTAAAPAATGPGLTPTVPPPFAVHYEKIGGIDDDGQAKLIADRLRAVMKGHSGCTVAVAGHADTLGGDRANYDLSKQRATEVADKLKAAFAGEPVEITQTQWGERRLTQWTPDDTADAANRRVDIKVSCEK